MGIFGEVKNAQVTGGGVYFLEGRYPRVRLAAAKIVNSVQGSGVFAVGEFEIIESNVAARPAGTKASHVIGMSGTQAKMGAVNVRKFANALFGLPADASADELEACASDLVGRAVNVEQICEMIYDPSPNNVFVGQDLALDIVMIVTRGKGQPFGRHDWSPFAAT
jgi:hypothetical protein